MEVRTHDNAGYNDDNPEEDNAKHSVTITTSNNISPYFV